MTPKIKELRAHFSVLFKIDCPRCTKKDMYVVHADMSYDPNRELLTYECPHCDTTIIINPEEIAEETVNFFNEANKEDLVNMVTEPVVCLKDIDYDRDGKEDVVCDARR